MTTEVSIMNMHAVALAADSAVTIRTGNGSEQKIFNSVNKLFTLSKYNPVGVMIYGSASYMRMPWETVIKVYRKKLGEDKKDRVEDYANDFLEHVTSIIQDEPELNYTERSHIVGFFNALKDEVFEELESQVKPGECGSEEEFNAYAKACLESKIALMDERVREARTVPLAEPSHAREKILSCRIDVDAIWSDIFGEYPITAELKERIYNICAEAAVIEYFFTQNNSGIVVAGFGEKELYPVQVSMEIEGYMFGFLKYKNYSVTSIDVNNSAVITPFAQDEVIANFMQGVDPVLFSSIKEIFRSIGEEIYPDLIESILRDKGVDSSIVESVVESLRENGSAQTAQIIQKLDLHSRQWHVDPIVQAVGFLPKEELAQLAESLVNLTSVRRRMSTNAETVGGPVDVAVISKGDGFIWINRKHYFDPALNDHFFKNYYRG